MAELIFVTGLWFTRVSLGLSTLWVPTAARAEDSRFLDDSRRLLDESVFSKQQGLGQPGDMTQA
jgi:hypothetical protein